MDHTKGIPKDILTNAPENAPAGAPSDTPAGTPTGLPPTGRAGRRWGRFWLLMAPAAASVAALTAAVAQGAVAASVAASGESFKVSGDRLAGSGFTAVPGVNSEPGGGRHPVVRVTAREAELENLCVSVLVPTPVGEMTVRVRAGTTQPVRATGLSVDADHVRGSVNFTDVTAQALGRPSAGQGPGGFLARTARVVVREPKFTGWRGTAGSFELRDLSLRLVPGAAECF
ncbi:cholesterol esterase [Streptomyces bluensis]|nr:cholesterol esterase [Streptomyces bluensis]